MGVAILDMLLKTTTINKPQLYNQIVSSTYLNGSRANNKPAKFATNFAKLIT